MYNPPLFREQRLDVLERTMAQSPLATLVTLGSDGLCISQLPLLYSAATGTSGTLRGHMARANSQWRSYDINTAALAIFRGPDHYISPSWYVAKAEHGMVVPTWNYVTIEARGHMRVIEDRDWILANVRELTASQEQAFENPWRVEDAPSEFIEKLLHSIIGVEIELDSLEGKWKMSQNRSRADRAGIVDGLATLGSRRALEVADLVASLNAEPATND